MVHVVDLDGAFTDKNSPNRQVLREIVRSIDIPIQFGGGLRKIQDVRDVIQLGVTRVVIGTLAVEEPETLIKLVHLFGGKHVVVGIDAKDGLVMTRGWETQESIGALALARKVAEMGIERIVYTDVQRDGTLSGLNIDQTCFIAGGCGLKVTASGGVSSLEDLKRLRVLKESGVDSVIIGKALYEGLFTIQEALAVASGPV